MEMYLQMKTAKPNTRALLIALSTFGMAGAAWAATFDGTAGNDVIDASFQPQGTTEDRDNVNGLEGDDTIHGLGGPDFLHGNEGNDTIHGGPGNDSLYGEAGDDTLHGDDGDDTLRAGDGNDTLVGGPGGDDLRGEAGDDTLTGGSGDDALYGQTGNDTLDGGDGNDVLHGKEGDDVINGGPGDDTIEAWTGNDTIDGGDGDDNIKSGYAGDQDNTNTVQGGNGADTINGGSGTDIIDGGAGNDEIYAGAGNDTVTGGGSNDIVDGGAGNDIVHGGDGDDQVYGGNHSDFVYGGAGNDSVYGGGGDNNPSGYNYLDGQEGSDELIGTAFTDILIARDGVDHPDVLSGQGYNDTFVIVGNKLDGHIIRDTYNTDTGEITDSGGDLVMFVKDVNPDQLTEFDVGGRFWIEVDHGLRTDEPVQIDLNNEPNLHFIEAVVTGTADDLVIGTDLDNHNTYHGRFNAAGNGWLHVNELFFTGPGNDSIDTGPGGGDFIDAGEGSDTITLNATGAHYVLGGPGNDTITLPADELTDSSNYGPKRRIADLQRGDLLQLAGNVSKDDITFVQDDNWGGPGKRVKVLKDGVYVLDLLNVTQRFITATTVQGGVQIKNTEQPRDVVASPVGPVKEGATEGGKQTEGEVRQKIER